MANEGTTAESTITVTLPVADANELMLAMGMLHRLGSAGNHRALQASQRAGHAVMEILSVLELATARERAEADPLAQIPRGTS